MNTKTTKQQNASRVFGSASTGESTSWESASGQSPFSHSPEIVAPAGNLEKLELAYRMGADACYIGTSAFSMRTRENKVVEDDLIKAKEIARKYGKKIYIAVNTFPHNHQIDALREYLTFLAKLNPDAIIFADPSVLTLAKEVGVKSRIHLSVQTSTANWMSVKFWYGLGVRRVVLARELSLKEILEIREKVPEMELEAFVHGSVCMAYSGRCFLSSTFSGRDANQGMCAHTCRDAFKVKSALVQNVEYGDQEMVIEEDEHGSHIISSKDMCLLPHLDKLIDTGIHGFKIEGRNKSEYYLAVVVRTYRAAIDQYLSGEKYDETLMDEIHKTKNRGFFSGFYFPELKEESERHEGDQASSTARYYIGQIMAIQDDNISIRVKGKIKTNEKVRLLTDKLGTEKILTITKISINGKEAAEASGGVDAVINIAEEIDESWDGLLLQKIDE